MNQVKQIKNALNNRGYINIILSLKFYLKIFLSIFL